MKTLIFALCIAAVSTASAQTKIYVDKKNNVTDQKSAVAYLMVAPKAPTDSVYAVKQYTKGGQLLSEAAYKDQQLTIAHGKFVFYKLSEGYAVPPLQPAEDGMKVTAAKPAAYLYSEGYFLNNKKEGEWKYYYLDGKVKNTEFYKNDVLVKKAK